MADEADPEAAARIQDLITITTLKGDDTDREIEGILLLKQLALDLVSVAAARTSKMQK